MASTTSDRAENAEKEKEETPPPLPEPSEPSEPVYYFFYGTLTNPRLLRRILNLVEAPQLRKANIFGYTPTKWGPFRTLVPGQKEDMIEGYAYLVETAAHEQVLAHYETRAYKADVTRIFFADNEAPPQVEGKVFVYAGNPRDLLDVEGDSS